MLGTAMWRRIGVPGHRPDGDTDADTFQQLRRRACWGGRCKARGLPRHLPGRGSSGFADEMTFARGPADRTFWAEKEVDGVHTEGGAEAKPREGEGTSCLGSGESLVRRAQATPR